VRGDERWPGDFDKAPFAPGNSSELAPRVRASPPPDAQKRLPKSIGLEIELKVKLFAQTREITFNSKIVGEIHFFSSVWLFIKTILN